MKYYIIFLHKISPSLDLSRYFYAMRWMLHALENASRAHIADER